MIMMVNGEGRGKGLVLAAHARMEHLAVYSLVLICARMCGDPCVRRMAGPMTMNAGPGKEEWR